jgi:2,3-bisphosphoglycerate-independent phosphoglycerate mutase
MDNKQVILIVRDGWGYSEEKKGDATYIAKTPNNDKYLESYPWTLLKCTGEAVGLPEGTQGGSEPGHITMGAGRVIPQPLERINKSIRNGSFYENKTLVKALKKCKKTENKLHLAGLLSDQGIHGTVNHLYALLELAKRIGLHDVLIHCFLDGRDAPERSATTYINELEDVIKEKNVGKIASMIGRYYAMDRDANWGRTEKAYNLLTLGEGNKEKNPEIGLENAYMKQDVSDYYIKPTIMIDENGKPLGTIDDGDTFILWNYRSDRSRQITYALSQDKFTGFTRKKKVDINYICMSNYDDELNLPVVFPYLNVKNNLSEVLSKSGVKQLRIAETEKYAQVTYFFNSQIEKPYPLEERVLVPSSKVPSYEDKPEMSAFEITKILKKMIKKRVYGFILINYANGDLVGHSANMSAAVKACEVVDQCVGEIVEIGLQNDYIILLTGDHGNVDTMFYSDGTPNPSHGLNPVPFILISDSGKKLSLKEGCGLSNIAPTVLDIMNIKKPVEMTCPSLINH